MRAKHGTSNLSVRAVAGTHVVSLAWDVSQQFKTDGLLGFAVERSELRLGTVVERYFLRAMKRFQGKDDGLPSGSQVPTTEHPIQAFQWADYTVKPGCSYRYRVVPCRGAPKLLTLDDAGAVEVPIETEPEMGKSHSVYFNRGVAGSQAYARKFGNARPDIGVPRSPQMTWLSRGLYEALLAFIEQAKGDGNWSLRAALYEFHYDPIGEAFRAALEAGADVKILYDEPNYGDKNRAMIERCSLKAVCAPRALGGAQKHNKFIVILKEGQPVGVWTGSTNISAGGIFGHSNVGHVVRDAEVARQYLDYWEQLCGALDPSAESKPLRLARSDPGRAELAAWTAANSIEPSLPPHKGTCAVFSPRQRSTLKYYADLLASAKEMACLTVAFTLAKEFEPFLGEDNDVLRYVLSDKRLAQRDLIQRDRDVLYAAGSAFDEEAPGGFLLERLTGLNSNRYIHDKFMLVDPLGDNPTVVTGSANFSAASQTSNDENMLVIRGDKRVADIYFGEFLRLFDHLYARYLSDVIREREKESGSSRARSGLGSGYLAPDDGWVRAHISGAKKRRRLVFHGAWGASE